MKSDKKQSFVMIGIVFLILAGIMLYVSLSAPRVYDNSVGADSKSAAAYTEEEEIKYPVNINTASEEQLAKVEGLSKKDAFAIVAYREQIGQFKDVSEILNIKGIGETKYTKVAPLLTV